MPYKEHLIDWYKGADPHKIDTNSGWAIAIVGLGLPVTFSRDNFAAQGRVVEGAFSRKSLPLVLSDTVVSCQVQNNKKGHVKNLNATILPELNLLNHENVLPGDWVLAWFWNNETDKNRILKNLASALRANDRSSGLKFLGRVHSIRKTVSVSADGKREARYNLQALGFDELDTSLFYDFNLATLASQDTSGSKFSEFMAQMGLDFFAFVEKSIQGIVEQKDNSAEIIEQLVNIVVGRGIIKPVVQEALDNAQDQARITVAKQGNPGNAISDERLQITSQSREAPFAYLVPVSVATVLGRSTSEKSKEGVFGYSDILDTLIGVQTYEVNPDDKSGGYGSYFFPPNSSFYPVLDMEVGIGNRKRTPDTIKGTHLPVGPTFVNKPLMSALQQYINPSINEIYTALKMNDGGDIVPTVVARQIPFSTEAIKQKDEFPLTKFMSLPRWVIHPSMVSSFDVGRSNASRINMVHVYGDASLFGDNVNITSQMVLNPPIFDNIDIARSGIKPYMQTVNCAIQDLTRPDGGRVWMEAISDWMMGGHLTLNGTITCTGIQAPVAEGDNVEFEGIVYHIESINHAGSITPDGQKQFATTMRLSNGMPDDQSNVVNFPRYPGFVNWTRDDVKKNKQYTVHIEQEAESKSVEREQTGGEQVVTVTEEDRVVSVNEVIGDEDALTSLDPGESVER